MSNLVNAYGILIFYGILSIIGAAIGNHFDKVSGFTRGYVLGTIISLILWYTVGHKAANVKL